MISTHIMKATAAVPKAKHTIYIHINILNYNYLLKKERSARLKTDIMSTSEWEMPRGLIYVNSLTKEEKTV
jgi:C4-dicarboxylate transporter